MTRTFSAESWRASQQAWADGGFGREWRDVRHAAALRGLIYPPEGSAEDSWEADSPSPRSMVYRAIQDTPALLMACIRTSSTWSQVIANLIARRDQWRADLRAQEVCQPADEGATTREATVALKRILDRIGWQTATGSATPATGLPNPDEKWTKTGSLTGAL